MDRLIGEKPRRRRDPTRTWGKPGGLRHCPAFEVAAVDTNAAGDVFHGAFAVGVAENMPFADVIRFSSAAAAIKCTRYGGRLGAPARAEVDAFLSEQGTEQTGDDHELRPV